MRLREIFQQYEEAVSDRIDAITNRANDTIKSAKVQKTNAEIAKARDSLRQKQAKLTGITKGN